MRFEWRDSWELPLLEISALCTRQDPGGGGERLLAVGDEGWAIAAVALGELAAPPAPVDVTPAITSAGVSADAGSEFEGVASDARGRVFTLQEGPACVLVFDAAMAVLQHTIALNVSSAHPHVRAKWERDPNSRGEGMVLLRDGHILVAKQRNPMRLLEFGPAGDPPLGYAAGGALDDSTPFHLASGSDSALELLATWSLDPDETVESINDLAVDGEGRLHFISSLSRCIGRLEADLDPNRDTVAARIRPLPGRLFSHKDDKAEGLVFTTALGWLVALDLQRRAPNVHQLALVTGEPYSAAHLRVCETRHGRLT